LSTLRLLALCKHIEVALGNYDISWFLIIHQRPALASTKQKVLQAVVNVAEHIFIGLIGVSLARHFHAFVGVSALEAFDKLRTAPIYDKRWLAFDHLGQLGGDCL